VRERQRPANAWSGGVGASNAPKCQAGREGRGLAIQGQGSGSLAHVEANASTNIGSLVFAWGENPQNASWETSSSRA
jgi:hypothetical protein